MSLMCYPLFLHYKLLNMFQATVCPPLGADDCVVLSPHVGIVLNNEWYYSDMSICVGQYVLCLSGLWQI